MTLRLGDTAPDFEAETTEGKVKFHDWKEGSWAVLFSHPADFTPVCTTELGRVAALKDQFARRNTKVIGLSVDSIEHHDGWKGDIADVTGHAVELPPHCRPRPGGGHPLRHDPPRTRAPRRRCGRCS